MSWFQKNYEKAAIGGGAVVALGLACLGWMQFNKVDVDFDSSLKGRGNNDPAVKGAELIPQTLSSMQLDRVMKPAEVDGREIDLFAGVPLFIGKADTTKPVDLYKSEPIHPPIPNLWWLENKLDPGFADSPQRDPDGDGFSNLQEFEAKTDPNDSKSHPALVNKLKFVKDESVKWILRPGFESDGGFQFRYVEFQDGTDKQKAGPFPSEVALPDALFFVGASKALERSDVSGDYKNRFKFLSSEKRKVKNEKFGTEEDVTFVKVEDQRPNKKGQVYEIPAPLSESRAAEYTNFDRKAVLSLEAIGQEGKEFKIEEKTAFALPPDASEKSYFLQEVSPEAIVVEYSSPDGAKKTIKIPKGGTGE
ncbi:MAG: thrombospondin type 3 repeat-containing protein [Luteolibacter sp.]